MQRRLPQGRAPLSRRWPLSAFEHVCRLDDTTAASARRRRPVRGYAVAASQTDTPATSRRGDGGPRRSPDRTVFSFEPSLAAALSPAIAIAPARPA